MNDQLQHLLDEIGKIVLLEKKVKSWQGRCPFHQEQTPSFTVGSGYLSSTEEERPATFHCFGCGAEGDLQDFYRLLDEHNRKHPVLFTIENSEGSKASG
jgi:DNA primase